MAHQGAHALLLPMPSGPDLEHSIYEVTLLQLLQKLILRQNSCNALPQIAVLGWLQLNVHETPGS